MLNPATAYAKCASNPAHARYRRSLKLHFTLIIENTFSTFIRTFPLPPPTNHHIGRVAGGPVKPPVGQYNHPAIVLPQQGLKSLVVNIGSGAVPVANQPELVQYRA